MNMVNKRGLWLAWTVVGAVAMIGQPAAQAGGGLYAWLSGHHTIPRETLAKDYRTGGVMYAPPIPYGEYAKDYAGTIHGGVQTAAGLAHGAISKVCGACGGLGCGLCGGKGALTGDACGTCGGSGHGQGGNACGGCGGSGLLSGLGHGQGHNHGANGAFCGDCAGNGNGAAFIGSTGHSHKSGRGLLGHKHHKGASVVMASQQSIASPQAFPSAQGLACDSCHGKGKKFGSACGGCGGLGKKLSGLCGGCGGNGRLGNGACGSCGGCGLLSCLKGGRGHGHGMGSACGGCGGTGNGGACNACGGCGLLDGAGKAVHHVAGTAHGMATNLGYKLGHGGVEYFVGPGGPVPITPGYVPYINPLRSPRDFFAFPPFSESAGVGQMDP